MLYAIIGMGIALAVAMGYAKIEHSGRLAAEAQVEARDATIREQNAAVLALKVEGDRKLSEASKGVAKAKEGTQAARTEAERLRVLASVPVKPGACPAADGVALVREGLKP